MLAIPATIVGIIYLVLQHLAALREFQHQELMKAIEVGLHWQDSNEDKRSERHAYQPFWIAFWLVICDGGAPFCSVSKFVDSDSDLRIVAMGWIAAGLATIVASIGAVVLVVKSKPSR